MRSPALRALLSSGTLVKVPKGDSLPSSDSRQQVALIKSGFVKRFLITEDGSLGIQIIYGRGDFFPLTLLYKLLLDQDIYTGPEVYHYKAMTDCQLYTMRPEEFVKKVQENPRIYRDLFSEAGQHLASCIHRLENMTMPNAEKRVAHILLFYGQKYGHDETNGVKLTLNMTQQDIADILSVTRETVSAAMRELKQAKLITGSREIVIHDIQKLQDHAYS